MTGLHIGASGPAFSALFDPGWQDRMLDNISRSQFSPEAMVIALVFFGGFALVIVFGLLVKIDFRKKEKDIPLTWIVNKGRIRDILGQALRQRSKVRVSFQREDRSAKSTDATLSDFSSAGLTLDLTSLTSLNSHWTGKLIDCDFRLRPDPKSERQVFYNFTVTIAAVTKTPEEFIRLRVQVPERLEQEQKRSCLRIEPPSGMILSLRLWTEDAVRAHGRAGDPATWGPPFLVMDRGMPEAMRMVDLSGGGMRMEFDTATYKTERRYFESAGRYLVELDLADPDREGPHRFYLLARIQNIYTGKDDPAVRSFGFRFLASGVEAPERPGLLQWKTAAESGVHELDDWVFNRHLDLYRSKGL